MAIYDCSACEELRQTAPNFVVNGMSDTECASLANNTGLNASSGHDDCEDLNDMNDCLVKNMENEINAYNVCSWKDYMKALVNNLWTMFKGVICAICGIWTNIVNIWQAINKINCELNALNSGININIGESETDGSYMVAGKGISFLTVSTGQSHTTDLSVRNYGNFVRVNGSLAFYTKVNGGDTFTDAAECWNFDNGGTIRKTQTRSKNPIWRNTTGTTAVTVTGGELLYEVRINLSKYPEIATIVSGIGGPTGGGAYQVNFPVFHPGSYAYGQHGHCKDDGTAYEDMDIGHLVPEGWLYIQARMVNISVLSADDDGTKYSPRGWMAMKLNRNAIEC